MADRTPPSGLELATSYEMLAANVLENTFALRKILTNEGSRSMDAAKVFTDVLAVNTMKTHGIDHSDKSLLTATTSEEALSGEKAVYKVSLYDRLGGGIEYEVRSDLSVAVTPVQGSTNGRTVSIRAQTFRWNNENNSHEGYLEHSVQRSDNRLVFVPYANPSLAGGDDLEGGSKLVVDQGLSSLGAGKSNRPPVLMAAEADTSHEGVRAVSGSGNFGRLENGFSQDGRIVYNGFSVVEQSGPDGESTFYNKHDLLRNATDRVSLEHALESGKPVSITIDKDGASARVHDARAPKLHVFRNGHEETLAAGFSQTGSLHDYGAFVGQEIKNGDHRAVTMFVKRELLESQSPREAKVLQDAIGHYRDVTIDLSQRAVVVDVSEHVSHSAPPAHTQNVNRSTSPGLERGSP